LTETGLFVKLYHAPRNEVVVIPDDAVRETLREDKHLVHFAVIRRGISRSRRTNCGCQNSRSPR